MTYFPGNVAVSHAHIGVNLNVDKTSLGRRDIRHFTTTVESNKMFHITFMLEAEEPSTTMLLALKMDGYTRVDDFFAEPSCNSSAALYQLDFGDGGRTMLISTMNHLGFTSSISQIDTKTVIVSGYISDGSATSRLYLGLLPALRDVDARTNVTRDIVQLKEYSSLQENPYNVRYIHTVLIVHIYFAPL